MRTEVRVDLQEPRLIPVRSPDECPGSKVLSGEAWQRVAFSLNLTERELQIAQCVFDQYKETVIARKLGIAVPTVHTHLQRLYGKLAIHGRVELVIRIFAEHLNSGPASHGGSAARPELPAAAMGPGELLS
jgi:DNA-binding CsgD family transcriptional regulator